MSNNKGYLQLKNLTKVFGELENGGVTAVDRMNLDIEQGEFIVFVGPSGCGKTTTLRMIAGLESITEGQILIDDQNVVNQPPRERDIAMVFQSYALYPHMTVSENMEYPLRVRGMSKDRRKRQVVENAKLLGIENLLDRRPKELSGGQQQRVALGRAIVREPKVFLFDEPLSNLDAKLRVQMRTELNRLHNKIGKTSIYVTHDQAEAMTLGDRVVVMKDGRIQQIAPPQTIYDSPVNKFVAGFVGSPQMNFFEGEYDPVSGKFSSDNLTTDIPDSVTEVIDKKIPVVMGVRPESIDIKLKREITESAVSAQILVVEKMGSEFFLTMKTGSVEYQAIVDPKSNIQRDDEVEVIFDPEAIHLFDSVSGRSLSSDAGTEN
jgi:multiple sugar transport system ATP-binding protein